MNKKILFTLLIALILSASIVNASYILQLKYVDGKVIQEAVYPSNSTATPSTNGLMDLTLGNYSTTIGFPLLEATDTPSGTNGVHESSDPEVFVIVDEVPIGTTLTIKDAEGSTLLSEPLKELTLPPTLEQIQASNEENTSSAAAGAGVLLGGFILLLIMGIGCIVVLIVVIVIAYFVFFKKKTNLSAPSQKKKFR